jgi:hypothetical protein
MFKISFKKGRKFGLCSVSVVSKAYSGSGKAFNLRNSPIVIHINLSNDRHIPSAMCTPFSQRQFI